MAATEQLGNLGYLALIEESAEATPLTPTVYVPLYEEDMMTKVNLDENNAIMGHKFERHSVIQGVRSHVGTVQVLGEPNTAAHFFNMLLNKSGTSGGGPYTHTFALNNTKPSTYTVDIAVGRQVKRFFGVQASSIKPSFNNNKMHLEIAMSARKSFISRTIASISGSGPYTIVFNTDYDPSPTTGLVVGDLIQVYDVSADSYISAVVDTIENATDITVSENVSAAAAGDIVTLRAGTPSFSLLTPFLWSRTEFRFHATAAASALTATHTPVEPGSEWEVVHNFEDDEGAKRSGSYDPAALPRTTGLLNLKIKQFFDDPQELNRFLTNGSRALVIRHFSETGYELRITANEIHAKENGVPPVKTGEILYQEVEYAPVYDTSDSQGFDVKVLNGLSSL